jgi:glutamate dehydrogenase
MPTSKQITEFCLGANKKLKKSELKGYEQFLSLYLRHYEDVGGLDDIYGYLSDMAQQAHAFLNQKEKNAYAIDVSKVNVSIGYETKMVRLLILYDDIPFVPDSVRAVLQSLNYKVFRGNLLPNFQAVQCNGYMGFDQLEQGGKSLYCLDLESLSGEIDLKLLQKDIVAVLDDVKKVVHDWRRMQDSLRMVMYAWQDQASEHISDEVIQENLLLMEWLLHHFTFLGYKGYKVKDGRGRKLAKTWGLDIPKLGSSGAYAGGLPSHGEDSHWPLFMLTKLTEVYKVHRFVSPEVLVLNVYDPEGVLIEQHQFMGMFTADAYAQDVEKIPVMRVKVKQLIKMQKLRSRYMIRKLKHLIKSYPLEELFQADINHLSSNFERVLRSDERQSSQIDIRLNVLEQFYSVMVYAPKDVFKTSLRNQIQALLLEECKGNLMHYSPYFTESALVRLHFVIEAKSRIEDELKLKRKIESLCTSWGRKLTSTLCVLMGPKPGYSLAKQFLFCTSDAYQAAHTPEQAAVDAKKYDQMQDKIAVHVEPYGMGLEITVYQKDSEHPLTLNQTFPVLSNLGFDVRSERYFDEKIGQEQLHISRYHCLMQDDSTEQCQNIEGVEDSMLAILLQKTSNDRLNTLISSACLAIDSIDIIRAYVEYMHQVSFGISKSRVVDFIVRHPSFAKQIIKYFMLKFQPKLINRDRILSKSKKGLQSLCSDAKSIDEERIISMLVSCIDATVRTNFSIPNRQAIALKISAKMVPSLSAPVPLYHAFVYGRSVMGIHIRYSKVSRGGLRCSDRLDDFHEEVSRLAATQRLKNTLTIPDGGKGGFVCRRINQFDIADRAEEMQNCYKIFINALLSLADNMVNNKVVRSIYVHAYDDHDPYFVVAADKGTATYSPVANEISLSHDFWLGDAFASGGQNGYDHKKMGITARGAWESVKWHAKKIKIDVSTQPFTVAGIGDMSGDVFGNGMLLSDQIKLVAAFGYGRIFIDPSPDVEKSYQERLRLFRLKQSSWADYNPALISEGGGVFERSQKYIELTPQMKKLFQTTKSKMEPSEMISAILCMQVDLLWNGGIGVFVKSSTETHFDVKDVSNDISRVDAHKMRAKMFVEGGNNGLTQKARIDYALSGGLINTDFIDNSAGVNVSDLEVNLKILFKMVIDAGEMDLTQRNRLIKKLSKSVSEIVLWNNYQQNALIDLSVHESSAMMNQYIRFMDLLSEQGFIDRESDCLPTKQELKARSHELLTRPEIAVLLSYSKIYLSTLLDASTFLASDLAKSYLFDYFPVEIKDAYAGYIERHPLKESIIKTQLVNTLVSEVGVVFLTQIIDECACHSDQAILAYTLARKILDIDSLYRDAMSLGKIDDDLKIAIIADIKRSLYLSVRWILRHLNLSQPKQIIAQYEGISELSPYMLLHLPKKYTNRSYKLMHQLQGLKVSNELTKKIKQVRYAYQLFNVRFAQIHTQVDGEFVTYVYYQIANWIKFHQIRERLLIIQEQSYWDRIQKFALEDDLTQIMTLLTMQVLSYAKKHDIEHTLALREWLDFASGVNANIRLPLVELLDLRSIDYSVFSVVISRIKKQVEDKAYV